MAWSSVGVPDDAAQALASGGELVFELADAVLGVACLGGAGVAFAGKPAGSLLQLRDARDQLGLFGSFDLGAELETEPAAELVALGAQLADFLPGYGEVRAQAGLADRLAAGRCSGDGSLVLLGLTPRAAWTCSRTPSA